MASFVIEGGHKLCGDIHPQGAKNEVLQIICATLLTAEKVTVNNIPDILDVNNLIQLMRDMGVTVAKEGIDTYSFQAENVDLAYLESDEFLKKCSSLRGSVMLIGPMVARFGKAMISKPPYCIVYGNDESVRDEMVQAMTKKVGYPPVECFQIGAAIAINAGPKVTGVIFKAQNK